MISKGKIRNITANAFVAGSVFLLLDYLFFEKLTFDVKQQDLGEPLDTDTKVSFVMLGELSIGKKIKSDVRKLVYTINALAPDFILFTEHVDSKPKSLEDFLSLLNPDIRKIGICKAENINRDNYSRIRQRISSFNADLLLNETKVYTFRNKRIAITGITNGENEEIIRDSLETLKYEPNHLLLLKTPVLQEKILSVIAKINKKRNALQKINFSYLFTSFTTDWQHEIEKLLPLYLHQNIEYVDGWYNQEKPYMYVAPGLKSLQVSSRLGIKVDLIQFNYHL